MIEYVLIVVCIVILGLAGGQGRWKGGKAYRRYLLPITSLIGALKWGEGWVSLSWLLLIPILAMGYGESSFLMNWLGSDGWVRVVYALLLSIPFLVYNTIKSGLRGLVTWVISAVLLVGAFQVRAGSLGFIEGFGDLLIEDLVRYGTLAGLLVFSFK